MYRLLSFLLAAALATPLVNAQFISELRITQTGPDLDEYVELTFFQGAQPLDGYTYLVIESTLTEPAVIVQAIDLTGQAVPPDGFFVIGESTLSLATPDLVTNLEFNDLVNVSHVLVSGFTGGVGDVLDMDFFSMQNPPWMMLHDCMTILNVPTLGMAPNCGEAAFGSAEPVGHRYFCFDAYSTGSLDVAMGADSPGGPTPGCGGIFCNPAQPNSMGTDVFLGWSFSAQSPSGYRLDAFGGPPQQFGYMLVGTAIASSPIQVSQGQLCLDFSPGQQVGRYNISQSPMDSIGMFDATGFFQNLVGTSTIGSGFDVPLTLPFGTSPTIQSGETYYFQLWYRDQAAGQGVSNFSTGAVLTF